MTDFEKKCECGHVGMEHLLKEETITIFALLVPFFRTIQLGRGSCKKCTCQKFQQHSLFFSKRKKEYFPIVKNLEDFEQRCKRCGRLFLSHQEAAHPFQENTITN